MQAAVNAGATAEQFWDEWDEYDAIVFINGYQHRLDDQREILAHNVASLINSNRTRGQRKVKAKDIFDREALEQARKLASQTANETPEQAAMKQIAAQEKAERLPVPRKLREHR